MKTYLNRLESLLVAPSYPQRGKLPDGTPLRAHSLIGTSDRYPLDPFPLVTTKRVPFRHVAEELFWFLRGETNVRSLQSRGVTIWDEWADGDGNLGPIYGHQWRRWPDPRDPDHPFDQIALLVANIHAVRHHPEHPAARRLILTAWNPSALPAMALPPCHYAAQWFVRDGKLTCLFHMRSCDFFLGAPFNIASYALLTHLLARSAGLGVGELIHEVGDAHIYENHIPQVREQLARPPRALPRLVIDGPDDFSQLTAAHVELLGYDPWPTIRGEVAV